MKQLLEKTLEDRLAYLINDRAIKQPQLMSDVEAVERKKELFARRQVEISVSSGLTGRPNERFKDMNSADISPLFMT
ncbi:hypothetical protein GPJ55_24405 [Bacillus subtilis]|nr:hypothetical protein GPJ55_24405 [Bacillus subtilis]